MRKAISEGKFREDLYYRLNTIPIQIPPLRNRGNDIVLLFRLFAMQMAEKYHLPKITLTEPAKEILLKYKWPGNVRQLKNITEQMSVLSEKREIDVDTLGKFIPQDEESTQLATIKGNGNHSYESEREILYKILYELLAASPALPLSCRHCRCRWLCSRGGALHSLLRDTHKQSYRTYPWFQGPSCVVIITPTYNLSAQKVYYNNNNR